MLFLAKHAAAFFGGARVGRTRTPPEIALKWQLVRPQAREECRDMLVLAKHAAAFFGGVRVGRTRTPPEIALKWRLTIDVSGDFFWLAV